jgi:hypothetical protein
MCMNLCEFFQLYILAIDLPIDSIYMQMWLKVFCGMEVAAGVSTLINSYLTSSYKWVASSTLKNGC